MNMPWHDKTGLAKAGTFFATLLLVSIGFCGTNFVGVMFLSDLHSGPGPEAAWKAIPMTGLAITGYAEFIGIVIGAIGLVAVAIAMVIAEIIRLIKNR